MAASTISAPAMAADLRYDGESMLAAGSKGKPYWMLQAQCSGFFGATSGYMSEKGDTDAADKAKVQGVAFFRDAVDRLVRDRKVSRSAAIELVSRSVDAGRAQGLQNIRDGGIQPSSNWNVARSVCLDVNDAYKAVRNR